MNCIKRGTKDTKGTGKLINLKQTDNAMAKYEKRQTNINITVPNKLVGNYCLFNDS